MPPKKPAARHAAIPASAFETASIRAGVPYVAGKSAIQGSSRARVICAPDLTFTQSVDLDTHFKAVEPGSTRWDYGVGLKYRSGLELAFWIEPHPASSTGEVQKMLDKLAWLKTKLATPEFSELKLLSDATSRNGSNPFRWQTTTDGAIRITANSKEARMLALKGLSMPARQITLP